MSSDNAIFGVATTGGVAATAATTSATNDNTSLPMWLLLAGALAALIALGLWARNRAKRK